MNIKDVVSIYSIAVGTLMVLMWSFLYFSSAIPELSQEPYRILMHLIGEITTAFVLIVSGTGLYFKRKWGYHLYLLGNGMLVYTLIVSPGYYLQNKNLVFVFMFFLLFIMTIILLVSFVKQARRWINEDWSMRD